MLDSQSGGRVLRRFIIVLVFSVLESSAAATPESIQPDNLSEDVLRSKREGVYYTGVPALASSPDSGFIYGVLMFRFDNGTREDDKFAYTPYLSKTNVLAVQSTKGLNQVEITGDVPYVAGTPFRIYPSFLYTKNISEQYFGVGEQTLADLQYPQALQTDYGLGRPKDFGEYQSELQKKRLQGDTYFRYNQYQHKELEMSFLAERAYFSRYMFFGAGASIRQVEVIDYSGDQVVAIQDGDETTAQMSTTKLEQDRQDGVIMASTGGRVHLVRLQSRFDSRDFEPDPSRGLAAGLTLESARQEMGSSQTFARYSVLLKGYTSPVSSLTLAGQARYVWSEGDVPFFELPSLGGRASLKGYRNARFRSHASSSVNAESRWRVYNWQSGGQSFAFVPVAFQDWGRVYDQSLVLSARRWRRSSGIGLRLVWNQATVIAAERALLGEEEALYVNVNHIF